MSSSTASRHSAVANSETTPSPPSHVQEDKIPERNPSISTAHLNAEVTRRQAGFDKPFGENMQGELSTCFLWLLNIHVDAFKAGGPLEFITCFADFVSLTSRNQGKEAVLYFQDTRSTEAARGLIKVHYSKLGIRMTAHCVTAAMYDELTMHDPLAGSIHGSETLRHGYDGEVIIQVRMTSDSHVRDRAPDISTHQHMCEKVYAFVNSFGDVKVEQEVDPLRPQPTLTWIFEFYKVEAADNLVNFCRTFPQGWTWSEEGLQIWAVHFHPVAFDAPETPPDMEFLNVNNPRRAFAHRFMGESSWYEAEGPPHPNLKDPNLRLGDDKHKINVEAIEQGRDTRTSIMLRNIPNRWTAAYLRHMLDQIVPGMFDFFYLRIDFRNNFNVGYCFINFEDSASILVLWDAIQGYQWPNSDKKAEITYATIQGRETIVEHFRNSSVMSEHPNCRPKLFYGSNDPRHGQEEPWPVVNNHYKFQRSMLNATHVGLFSACDRRRRMPRALPGHRGAFDLGNPFNSLRVTGANLTSRTPPGAWHTSPNWRDPSYRAPQPAIGRGRL